jgi:hypothetical protein
MTLKHIIILRFTATAKYAPFKIEPLSMSPKGQNMLRHINIRLFILNFFILDGFHSKIF